MADNETPYERIQRFKQEAAKKEGAAPPQSPPVPSPEEEMAKVRAPMQRHMEALQKALAAKDTKTTAAAVREIYKIGQGVTHKQVFFEAVAMASATCGAQAKGD